MSKERAAEAVKKSHDYKEVMAGLSALQPQDINPNPKPDGQTVIAPTGYSQYNMV